MASNSGWTTGLPSGNSLVANTDEEFRSLKSFQEAWWEQEHYATSGSATSAGVHKQGSARAFVQAAAPTTEVAQPAGQLWVDTDDDGLYYHDGSSWVLMTNAITLGSAQTWTGTQQIGDGTTGDLAIDPVNGDWKIERIVSGQTTIASDIGMAGGGTTSIALTVPNSALTHGDPVIIGSNFSDADASEAIQHTLWVSKSDGSLRCRLENLSVSRATLNAGTVVRWIGFTNT